VKCVPVCIDQKIARASQFDLGVGEERSCQIFERLAIYTAVGPVDETSSVGCATQHSEVQTLDLVIVGTDRIAANGDVANKIGTYEKAVVAHELGIPFYVTTPISTVDPDCPDGDHVPIEERSPDEVLYSYGLLDSGEMGRVRLAPLQSTARNIAFDVTPARYVTSIITERGIFDPQNILDALR